MNIKRLAVGVAAVGAVAVGALSLPAVAGAGPFGSGSAAPSSSTGPGGGRGPGSGMMPGRGMGPGSGTGPGGGMVPGSGGRMGSQGTDGCPMLGGAAQGTLTQEQRATLGAMAEEEKLAGDLYQAFADRYPATVFDRIAASEDQHLAAVRTLLDRYGLTDPTAGKPAGRFATASVQAEYDRLLQQGLAGQDSALAVGRQVERDDIADLREASTGLNAAPDVQRVYQHLLAASQHHLAAFTASPAR